MFGCSIDTYLQTIDAKLDEIKKQYPDLESKNDSEEQNNQVV